MILACVTRAECVSSQGGVSLVDGVLSGAPQVDIYNYSGSSSTYVTTWTRPDWAAVVYIWCIGGGGGGTGGGKNTSTLVTGGSGGSSAAPSDGWFLASGLPTTLTVSIGKGSTGGAGATVSNTSGSAAGSRNDSYVGQSGCSADPRSGTAYMCNVLSYGAAAVTFTWSGQTSSVSSCTGLSHNAPGVGGAGGGIASGVANDGSDGTSGCFSPLSLGAKGTVAGVPTGYAGASYLTGLRVGGGGGGGAASVISGVNGSKGGDGGVPGGGGGGGGSGLNDTNNGGVGGAGGNGQCVFVSF